MSSWFDGKICEVDDYHHGIGPIDGTLNLPGNLQVEEILSFFLVRALSGGVCTQIVDPEYFKTFLPTGLPGSAETTPRALGATRSSLFRRRKDLSSDSTAREATPPPTTPRPLPSSVVRKPRTPGSIGTRPRFRWLGMTGVDAPTEAAETRVCGEAPCSWGSASLDGRRSTVADAATSRSPQSPVMNRVASLGRTQLRWHWRVPELRRLRPGRRVAAASSATAAPARPLRPALHQGPRAGAYNRRERRRRREPRRAPELASVIRGNPGKGPPASACLAGPRAGPAGPDASDSIHGGRSRRPGPAARSSAPTP